MLVIIIIVQLLLLLSSLRLLHDNELKGDVAGNLQC